MDVKNEYGSDKNYYFVFSTIPLWQERGAFAFTVGHATDILPRRFCLEGLTSTPENLGSYHFIRCWDIWKTEKDSQPQMEEETWGEHDILGRMLSIRLLVFWG
jgi:hypothetical protein